MTADPVRARVAQELAALTPAEIEQASAELAADLAAGAARAEAASDEWDRVEAVVATMSPELRARCLAAAALPEADGETPERRARGENKSTLVLREAISRELEDYSGDMSTRQIFYQLASHEACQNNESDRRKVFRLVVNMRRDGSIPYDRIVDRTRRKHHRQGWDSLRDAIETTGAAYQRDLWANQDTVVMIGCEKQALEGIFAGIVDEYGASLWTIRGFNSESFEYEWSEEIKELNQAGKRVAVTYFGDFDPSGLAIEEVTRRKLAGFGAVFTWERGGLLHEDLDHFKLIRIPVKKGDSRSKAFKVKFGDNAAELDALGPAELEKRIRQAIEKHIDVDRWQRGRRTEQLERESLALVGKNWDAVLAAARATP